MSTPQPQTARRPAPNEAAAATTNTSIVPSFSASTTSGLLSASSEPPSTSASVSKTPQQTSRNNNNTNRKLLLSSTDVATILSEPPEKSSLLEPHAIPKPKKGTKKLSAKEEQELREFEQKRQVELERQAIVATVFANASLQHKGETLKQYERMYEMTTQENMHLNKEKMENEKDAQIVIEFMRNEIGKLNGQIKDMRISFFSSLDQERTARDEMEQKLKSIIADRDRQIVEKDNKIEQLRADLEALAAFRREKESLQRELHSLREQLHTSQLDHEREISLQRFTSLEEKIRVKALEKELHDKFESEVAERATSMLDDKTKLILEENKDLNQDREKRESEIEDALQQLDEARKEIARLTRELSISESTDHDLVKKLNAKSRENQSLKEQVETLEAKLNGVVSSARNSLVVADKTIKKDMSQMKNERDQAVSAAKILQNDLLHVRKLANVILQQRTDTENFFLDALSYIKHQIAFERKQGGSKPTVPAAITSVTPNSKTLALSPRPPQQQQQQQQGQLTPTSSSARSGTKNAGNDSSSSKNDIANLSWEDKERVIRALFAKIQSPYLESNKNVLADTTQQQQQQQIASMASETYLQQQQQLLMSSSELQERKLKQQQQQQLAITSSILNNNNQNSNNSSSSLAVAAVVSPRNKNNNKMEAKNPKLLTDNAHQQPTPLREEDNNNNNNNNNSSSQPQPPQIESNYLPTNGTNIFFITEGKGDGSIDDDNKTGRGKNKNKNKKTTDEDDGHDSPRISKDIDDGFGDDYSPHSDQRNDEQFAGLNDDDDDDDDYSDDDDQNEYNSQDEDAEDPYDSPKTDRTSSSSRGNSFRRKQRGNNSGRNSSSKNGSHQNKSPSIVTSSSTSVQQQNDTELATTTTLKEALEKKRQANREAKKDLDGFEEAPEPPARIAVKTPQHQEPEYKRSIRVDDEDEALPSSGQVVSLPPIANSSGRRGGRRGGGGGGAGRPSGPELNPEGAI